MDVSVFGTGYVGLIQAAALANVGHRVLCVDIDLNKIIQLQQSVPPISEPGFSSMLEDNIKAGRLLFSTLASDAIAPEGGD
jgi:UDPglucose 6-dehydrogenase